MRRQFAVGALMCAVVLVALAAPAQAQIPVTDVAHIGFTDFQTIQDWIIWLKQYEQWVRQFLPIDDPRYRSMEETLATMNGLLRYEDSPAWSKHGARMLYEAIYNDDIVIRPNPNGTWDEDHEFSDEWILANIWGGGEYEQGAASCEGVCDGIPADVWNEYWRKAVHDTYQGVFRTTQAAALDARRDEGPSLALLRGQLQSASGNVEALQAAGYIAMTQLEQTRRLQTQLAALTDLKLIQKSHKQVQQDVTANTLRSMMYYEGWDAEILYESYPELTSPWDE